MSAERSPSGPRRRPSTVRILVTLVLGFMVVSPFMFFVGGAGGRGFAVDHLRQAQQIEAREGHLYRQLAERDTLLETQRRMYMERFRSLEAQIQQKDQEIAALRARLATITSSHGRSD